MKVCGLYGRSGVPSGLTRIETAQEVIDKSDVIFITVTDRAIADVWNGSDIPGNKIVCHCSGSLSSEVFIGADPSMVCSVHPMLAFADKEVPVRRISEAFFTIEGGSAALKAIKHILDVCGNPYRVISARDKGKYHAAACFASNLAAALLSQSFALMEECGFSAEEARRALTPLILGNAENICAHGAKKALTGPVSRGDILTVRKHLSVLSGRTERIYRELSAELARISGHGEIEEILGG